MRRRGAYAFTAVVLRRLFSDRVSLFFVLVLPVIVIVIIGATFGGQFRLELGLVEAGGGPGADRLVEALANADGLAVTTYDDVDALRTAVRRGQVSAGVVVPASLDERLSEGGGVTVPLIVGPAADVAFSARVAVQGIVDELGARLSAATFATDHGGRSFAESLAFVDLVAGSGARVEVQDVGSGRVETLSRFSLVAPQNLVLFVFINSMATAALIVQARRSGILRRALATRTGIGTILLGLGAGWLAFALVQSGLILALGALAFGVDWGDPLAAALLVVVFALVGCGAGLLVGAIGRDEDRVGAITPIVGIVLGALGGCMVPLEVFPPAMRAVAHATPQYWAISAWQSLVFDGESVRAIAGSLAVLAGLAVVLVSAATAILRRDLTRGGMLAR